MINNNRPVSPSTPPPGERSSIAAQRAELKAQLSQHKLGNLTAGATLATGVGAAMMAGMTPPPGTQVMATAGLLGALAAGAMLKLPNDEVYQIQDNDTLWDIATTKLGENASPAEIKNFVAEIQQVNADIIENPDTIYSGDKIAVPSASQGSAKEKQDLFSDDPFGDPPPLPDFDSALPKNDAPDRSFDFNGKAVDMHIRPDGVEFKMKF